jgi:hypothetical protein
MKARPTAEAEKLIDKNDIIGNSAVDRSRQISGVNPLRAKWQKPYAAKELKQNLKHCKQLRKLLLYLQTEKVKKQMLQAINQIPL